MFSAPSGRSGRERGSLGLLSLSSNTGAVQQTSTETWKEWAVTTFSTSEFHLNSILSKSLKVYCCCWLLGLRGAARVLHSTVKKIIWLSWIIVELKKFWNRSLLIISGDSFLRKQDTLENSEYNSSYNRSVGGNFFLKINKTVLLIY